MDCRLSPSAELQEPFTVVCSSHLPPEVQDALGGQEGVPILAGQGQSLQQAMLSRER